MIRDRWGWLFGTGRRGFYHLKLSDSLADCYGNAVLGLETEQGAGSVEVQKGTEPVAFVDACCLVSMLKRELCLAFASAGLCHLKWSAEVLDETEWAIARMGVLREGLVPEEAAARAASTRRSLEAALPEALVPDVSVFLGQCPPLRDADDMHVVAGALAGRASLIVTENLRDFPRKKLARIGLQVRNVDGFLQGLSVSQPLAADQAISAVRERLEGGGVLIRPFHIAIAQAGLGSLVRLSG